MTTTTAKKPTPKKARKPRAQERPHKPSCMCRRCRKARGEGAGHGPDGPTRKLFAQLPCALLDRMEEHKNMVGVSLAFIVKIAVTQYLDNWKGAA